jgi:hypothetical protein
MGLQAKACCPFAFFPPDFPPDQRFVYLYCPTMALGIRSDAQMACVACKSSCIFVSLCDQYSLGSMESRRASLPTQIQFSAMSRAIAQVKADQTLVWDANAPW